MPTDRDERPRDRSPEEEEYRRHQEAKARRRQKKRMQKILLLGAFALAAVLLVLCIVMIFRAIFSSGEKPKTPSSISQVSSDVSDVQGVTWPVASDPTAWNLLLVNPQVPMPEGFEPELVPVSPIGHMFDSRAAEDLKLMIEDCNANEGYSLEVDSAYRGKATQDKKHNDLVAQGLSEEEANRIDPLFGYSDHQTGLGVDFKTGAYQQVDAGFAQTPEFSWLMQNCAKHGFILRFPENQTAFTGIDYQPYHFRYVGKEDAATIMQNNICLEQYLMALPDTGGVPPDDGSDAAAGSDAGVAMALPLAPWLAGKQETWFFV